MQNFWKLHKIFFTLYSTMVISSFDRWLHYHKIIMIWNFQNYLYFFEIHTIFMTSFPVDSGVEIKKSNSFILARVKKITFQKNFPPSLHPLGQNNCPKILEFENSNGDFYAICGGGTIFFGFCPVNWTCSFLWTRSNFFRSLLQISGFISNGNHFVGPKQNYVFRLYQTGGPRCKKL